MSISLEELVSDAMKKTNENCEAIEQLKNQFLFLERDKKKLSEIFEEIDRIAEKNLEVG
jgi:hypothetical protein